jgi:mRNA interferase RelE/StbE
VKRYQVVLSKTAEKNLSKFSSRDVVKIISAFQDLEINPRPVGCKKLKGFENLWRIRIGNYRAIYSINDVILLVDIRDVGHRKDIYK